MIWSGARRKTDASTQHQGRNALIRCCVKSSSRAEPVTAHAEPKAPTARSGNKQPTLLPLWRRLRRRHAVVLTWHRFTDRSIHPDRYPAALLRKHLRDASTAALRDHRASGTGGQARRSRCRLTRVVAFTVDDGYADFATLAAEVFLAYDCPVTTFVTTGFLDGQVWMWWDQVEYCLTNAGRCGVVVEIGGDVLDLDLSEPSRPASTLRLWTALKTLRTQIASRGTAELAALLDVDFRLLDLPIVARCVGRPTLARRGHPSPPIP